MQSASPYIWDSSILRIVKGSLRHSQSIATQIERILGFRIVTIQQVYIAIDIGDMREFRIENYNINANEAKEHTLVTR